MKWDSNGKPKKPTIVGIGAQKAGTTWLSQILGQHPEVWTPPLKEIQYFNYHHIQEHRSWLPWHFRRGKINIEKRYTARGEVMPDHIRDYLDQITSEPMFTQDWYQQVFAPAPQGTQPMEITPEYSTLSPEGVNHVADFLPQTKFIYIIRHPVDRAVSQMKMNITRAGRKPVTVDDWLREVEDPVLLDRGDYLTYVPRWDAQFDFERLLYLPFGAIKHNPEGFMELIEEFLGLGAYEYTGLRSKVFAANAALSVPAEARAALREKLEPQFAFLDSRFGKEFTTQMR